MENILHRLTIYKAMAKQNWPSKWLSVYSQTTWTVVASCVMIMQLVLCWLNATFLSMILVCLLLWYYMVVLSRTTSIKYHKYHIRNQWREIDELREVTIVKRHKWNEHFYNKHCCSLWELQIGDSVQIQNQDGPYPHWWTKTGRIIEILSNKQ